MHRGVQRRQRGPSKSVEEQQLDLPSERCGSVCFGKLQWSSSRSAGRWRCC